MLVTAWRKKIRFPPIVESGAVVVDLVRSVIPIPIVGEPTSMKKCSCHLPFQLRGVSRIRLGPTYIVLLLQFLAQVSAHADAALAGGSVEVSLARLPARRGETWKFISIFVRIGEIQGRRGEGKKRTQGVTYSGSWRAFCRSLLRGS